MAKAKKSTKKIKRKPQQVTRIPMAPRSPRVEGHLRMIMDPCNATITPTAYRGKDGFITRVAMNLAVNNGAASNAVVAYWPRYNRVFLLSNNSTTTTFALDFYNAVDGAPGPGGAFFGTNASEVRPVAACLTSSYLGTELDRQGAVVEGILPYRAVSGAVTIDGLCQTMQKWQRVPDHAVETKWIPSPTNENYNQTPSTLPTVTEDDNIIIQIFRGVTVGKMNFTTRVVGVMEWQPFWGLGLTNPTPNTDDPPAGLEVIRSQLSKFGNWWLSASHTAAQGVHTIGQVASGVRTIARAAAGTSRALGYAPALLLGA